jgi:hypothetical protein
MLLAFRSNAGPGLHNLVVSSKRHGASVLSASVSFHVYLAGCAKCNLQMRPGLFLLAFAFLFCGFEVAYDLHNTKEFEDRVIA